jgi:hypothetical protein
VPGRFFMGPFPDCGMVWVVNPYVYVASDEILPSKVWEELFFPNYLDGNLAFYNALMKHVIL